MLNLKKWIKGINIQLLGLERDEEVLGREILWKEQRRKIWNVKQQLEREETRADAGLPKYNATFRRQIRVSEASIRVFWGTTPWMKVVLLKQNAGFRGNQFQVWKSSTFSWVANQKWVCSKVIFDELQTLILTPPAGLYVRKNNDTEKVM